MRECPYCSSVYLTGDAHDRCVNCGAPTVAATFKFDITLDQMRRIKQQLDSQHNARGVLIIGKEPS